LLATWSLLKLYRTTVLRMLVSWRVKFYACTSTSLPGKCSVVPWVLQLIVCAPGTHICPLLSYLSYLIKFHIGMHVSD
jgi:hypothetical protein